jgi:hypothetical protein
MAICADNRLFHMDEFFLGKGEEVSMGTVFRQYTGRNSISRRVGKTVNRRSNIRVDKHFSSRFSDKRWRIQRELLHSK